jgi:F-type H+-transporting ATPase subunit gamma
MSVQLEKAQNRLDNVQRVKPILAALRTISLGSWQMARARRSGLGRYTDHLLALLPLVVPQGRESASRLGSVVSSLMGRWPGHPSRPAGTTRLVLLVVGSERGLCGRYNKALIDRLSRYVADLPDACEFSVTALGSRLVLELERGGYRPESTHPLSLTALPPFSLAHDLVVDWLDQYEAYEIDAVDVLCNQDTGAGGFAPSIVRLIPPELPEVAAIAETDLPSGFASSDSRGLDAEVIVETNPLGLYVRIVEQWTSIAMYRLLLEGATTEHSARFQLMESATQNADDLIDGLMQTVKSARRQAITRQMQELAVGAGLLES